MENERLTQLKNHFSEIRKDYEGIFEFMSRSNNINFPLSNNDGEHLARLGLSELQGVIPWIPFERLTEIEFLGKGGFGEVYSAALINADARGFARSLLMNFPEIVFDAGPVKQVAFKELNSNVIHEVRIKFSTNTKKTQA